MSLDPLKPDPNVQKFLISSTCRFTGEFETENLLVAHAWPNMRNRAAITKIADEAGVRSAFTLVFRTDPQDHEGFIIPNYDQAGDMVCGHLSLLYGKRFDNHGAVESSGYYRLPDLQIFEAFCAPFLPQNVHKPRPDLGIPLVLNEINRLTPLFFGETARSKAADTFRGSVKFYHQALQAAEHDVEIAYLHLITAGEILSGAIDVPPESLVDAQTRALLVRMELEMHEGARSTRIVRSKLRSVKRRFVASLIALIDPAFFDRSEAEQSFARIKANSFVKLLGAAYDLRSRYLHTGHSFGSWIAPRGVQIEETQTGRPVVDDKEFARVLAAAPTYIGLERIIRYALLRFGGRLGIDLDIQTNGSKLEPE